MELVVGLVILGGIALVIYLIGKYDPIIVIAWQCNKCKKIVGKGSFRRAEIAQAREEHTIVSPSCHGQLQPGEYKRIPFLP